MEILARSYQNSIGKDPYSAKVFFAVVDFDGAKEIFRKYDFKGVPQLIHIPPTTTKFQYTKQDNKK